MPHGPAHFASKGVCIYCVSNNTRLSDEHIVPYALGGSHVIRKASCRSCAAVTGSFEQRVLRDLWGDARTSYNAPTRRRKERRSYISLPDADGGGPLTVPASEYPGGFVFYKMYKAGLLQGLGNDVDLSLGWQLVVVDDDKRREEFLKKHPDKLTMQFRHVPDAFGRMLAKIGYGQVMTQLDPSDFDPICVPYILGRKTNVSFVVGGTMQPVEPQLGLGYHLQTAVFGSRSRILLIALVRLLANTRSPAYHVVVGDVVGIERVESVLEKLGVGGAAVPSRVGPNEHWAPDVTPLPYWVS